MSWQSSYYEQFHSIANGGKDPQQTMVGVRLNQHKIPDVIRPVVLKPPVTEHYVQIYVVIIHDQWQGKANLTGRCLLLKVTEFCSRES